MPAPGQQPAPAEGRVAVPPLRPDGQPEAAAVVRLAAALAPQPRAAAVAPPVGAHEAEVEGHPAVVPLQQLLAEAVAGLAVAAAAAAAAAAQRHPQVLLPQEVERLPAREGRRSTLQPPHQELGSTRHLH